MIYFVRGTRSGMVKIGSTENLKARMRSLRTASPEPLEVLAVVPGGLSEERALHDRFAEHRAVGEWFHPRRELLAFVEKLTRDPRIDHPALRRRTARTTMRSREAQRERLETIRLAAVKHGLSERDWFEKFAFPVVVEIAREQLDEDESIRRAS